MNKTSVTTSPTTQELNVVHGHSRLTSDDLHWFNEGTHSHLHEKLGAHLITRDGVEGTYFALWAPNAERVNVMGDFNDWNPTSHPLRARDAAGIWEGFVPGLKEGTLYKYHIFSRQAGFRTDKADPFAFQAQTPPDTASVVRRLDYEWNDDEWMAKRGERNRLNQPISVYEMHLGSWRRMPEEGNRPLTYRELAKPLAEYVQSMGFTHVEFLPVMEHPFYGSWGYQTTGYFAPTSRYGSPQDFMYLIDTLHQYGIGVILDWVPSHFPSDAHGLTYFDGTHLFEHADTRQGFHPDWKSCIFNYGRHEVRSFLMSSAFFWLEKYHIDGLRVDAVASMLYLDYSRQEGEWIPNRYGGRENLEAIDFLRDFNRRVFERFPDVQTIAEESTAWPMVSRPVEMGGLGFGMKWDMGWMHDTLDYLSKDPIHRKYHHGEITFRGVYAFTENFMLPLSHDEVVHGKGSLLRKMPGDSWQQFANLRLLLACQYAQPGKKLLFMGCEFGQPHEWQHENSLDWHLLEHGSHHGGVQRMVADLNRLYRDHPALHQGDANPEGFSWVDCHDVQNSTLSWLRHGLPRDGHEAVLVVCNFTPIPRENFRFGVPHGGHWQELFNSDAAEYGGSGMGNLGGVDALSEGFHGRPHSLSITLPPLAMVMFKSQ